MVLLDGFIDENGLHCFNNLTLDSSHNSTLSSFHKLYSFANNTTTNARNDSVSTNVDKRVMWHYRLSHANPRSVNHVLKLCNILVNNKCSKNFCHACRLNKSRRLHDPSTHTKYNSAFELIDTDLWGPSSAPSRGSYSYYVSFIDAHTRNTWIYMLNQKSDTLNAFKLF